MTQFDQTRKCSIALESGMLGGNTPLYFQLN